MIFNHALTRNFLIFLTRFQTSKSLFRLQSRFTIEAYTALAILEETICLIEKETKHTKKEKSESLIAFSLD